MKVAIVVGHNKESKGGYSKTLGAHEYDLYKNVASELLLKGEFDIIIRNPKNSYTQEMKEAIAKVNAGYYDLVIELHFNCANSSSIGGAEVLHFYKSNKGQKYAKKLSAIFAKNLEIRDRGAVPIKSINERGGYGICKSLPVYILIEPFFGTNPKDCRKVTVSSLAYSILEFIESVQA